MTICLTTCKATLCPQVLSLSWFSENSPSIVPVTEGVGGRKPQQGLAALGGTTVLFQRTQQKLRTCTPDLGTPNDPPRLLLGPE